jgi:MipA family protein
MSGIVAGTEERLTPSRVCRTPSSTRLSVVLALLLFTSGPSHAERKPRPLWEIGLGAATLSLPDYRGSDQQRGYLLPIPYLVYRGELIQVDREKVRGLLLKSDTFDLDMSASGSVPVRSSSNRARNGMPDLKPTIELGPQLDFKFVDNDRFRLGLHIPLRNVRTVDSHGLYNAGWLANPVLNLDLKDLGPDHGWNLGLSGGPLWADSRYHEYFYGVQPAYATAERPAYSARAGYSGAQFTMAVSKRYPRMWVGAFLRVNDLHGAVFEDSPLVKRKTGFMAGLGISWVFAHSHQMVMSDE